MASRSMWNGSLVWTSLIHIPVKLYTATEDGDMHFRMLHDADGGNIKFRRFCSACDKEVEQINIVKGYELPTHECIMLTDEDMASLPLASAKAITIEKFVDIKDVPNVYFEGRTYYIQPDKIALKAYALLRQALRQSRTYALVKVALRSKESMGVLRADGDVLVLELLRWPSEIREPEMPVLDTPVKLTTKEQQLARQLVEDMRGKFDPQNFTNDYQAALGMLVEGKISNHKPQAKAAPANLGAPDLTAALTASVTERRKRKS